MKVIATMLLAFSTYAPCAAQDAKVLNLSDLAKDALVTEITGYYIDSNSTELPGTVRLKLPNAGMTEANKALSQVNRNRTIWVRLNVWNKSSAYFEGLLLAYGYTEVTFYTYKEGTLVKETQRGLLHKDRLPNTVFGGYSDTLRIMPDEKLEVWASIKHSTRFTLLSGIYMHIGEYAYFQPNVDEIIKDNRRFGYFSFVFLGLLIFQLIYISFQWYLARRVEYRYYLLYIISLALYFGGRYVVLHCEFDWSTPFLAHLLDRQNDILLVLPAFFYYRFGRHYLDLGTTMPRLNIVVKRIEYFILAQTIFVALTNSLTANDLNKTQIVLGCIGIQFLLTVYVLRKIYRLGTPLSRFIVLGSIIAIGSHALSMSLPLWRSVISFNLQPASITMIGIILEIAIFNSGLLFKASEGERQKLLAQKAFLDELTKSQKLQEAYSSVRDRIASDLHDDVGSSLSSIGIYSYAAKVKLKEGKEDATRELLSMIEYNATETMNSMSDLVWAINPANDTAEKLILRIKSFCSPLLAAKEIRCTWNVDAHFQKAQLSQLERRNILFIFKEIINNMVKHSKASECSVSLTLNMHNLNVVIVDNGVGFDTGAPKSGNGLRTIKYRTDELKGYVEIDSDNSGTTYRILIKLDNPSA